MADPRLKDVLSKLPLNDKDKEYLYRAITALQTTPTGSTSAPAPTQTVVHTTHHETVSDDRIRAVIDNWLRSLPRLSVITHNAGDLVSGRFIAPAPTSLSAEPTDAAFTGSFVSGIGEEFSSVDYNVGGVNAGVLQWGAKQSDGTLIAGAGGIILDATALTLLNQSGTIQFRNVANDGNVGRLVGQSDNFFWIIGDRAGGKILLSQLMSNGVSLARITLSGDGFVVNSATEDVDTIVYGTEDSKSVFSVDAGLNQANMDSALALTGDISPATITAHQNDYNPTGLATASVLRLITDTGNYNITGLAGGSDGRIIVIRVLNGSGNIILKNEDAASTAANRFTLTRDITLLPNRAIVLQYDSTTSRWRDLATPDATSVQGVFVTAGLSATIAEGDILLYNAGDASFEDVNPTTYIGSYALEAVQDVVGGMVSGNSETGITVTYDDTNGKLDFSVSDSGLTSGPQAFGDNYVITPSVASSNLTVALKTVAGSDPSAGDPITVRIGNTKRTISAALSTTKNAGTNWCNAGASELATKAIDFFVYVIQETGASAGTKIGFSRIPYARTMGDFVNTTTSEKYIAGSWTNFNSTDEVEVIGRFRAQLTASASFNWSIASALVVNRPIYETDWLDWTPTHTRAGTNYTNLPTTLLANYKVEGRVAKLVEAHQQHGTPGGTGVQQMTLPWTNAVSRATQISASNNSAGTQFIMYVIQSAARGDYYKYDGTAEATANQIYGCGVGEYRIA